jgi:hypothetical protein
MFNTDELLSALDELGEAAVAAGERLDVAIYGGAALMLASNFRFSTEDVDIAEIGMPQPEWLDDAILRIARARSWSEDWLNDAVTFHLSSLATKHDHEIFGSFPRASIGDVGLTVSIPTADYMLALKLKAMRVNDPAKGATEIKDIRALLQVNGIGTVDRAIHCLAKFFPKSAAASEKQRFLLRNLFPELTGANKSQKSNRNAPRYPLRSGSRRDPGRDDFGR